MSKTRDLLAAATPGPWRNRGGPSEAEYVVSLASKDDFITGPLRPPNARLIAHLRNTAELREAVVDAARQTVAVNENDWWPTLVALRDALAAYDEADK